MAMKENQSMRLLQIVGLVVLIWACQENLIENPTDPCPAHKGNPTECASDDPVLVKQARLAEALFGLGRCEADNYPDELTINYNNYKNCPPGFDCDPKTGDSGYKGGHAGWDVRTKSVVDTPTANEPFYSLTFGEVIAIDRDKLGKIAVYNAPNKKTIVYLHAQEIFVREGQPVNVGTCLGIQGNKGLKVSDPNERKHVHVEVRKDSTIYAALGADLHEDLPQSKRNPTINPIVYLYEEIQQAKSCPVPCGAMP